MHVATRLSGADTGEVVGGVLAGESDGEESRGVHDLLIWDAGAEESASLVMTGEAMQPRDLEKRVQM